MTRTALRRIACVAAAAALGISSSPRMQAATAPSGAPQSPAPTASAIANGAQARVSTVEPSGRGGFGAMLGCAVCAVGAGMIIAGGPGAILAAVNAPGSAATLLACGSACYEAAT